MENSLEPLYSQRICRFCLSDSRPLNSIYERTDNKSVHVPLTLQIMSCVAIEVYAEDEMPQVICNMCRWNLDRSYKFKLQCKKADEALRDYLLSGKLPKPFPPIPIDPPTENGNKRLAESISQNEASKKRRISNDETCETRKQKRERENEPQNASNIEEERKQKPAEILRVHSCNQCERTFALRQALLLHVQRVHRARNYKCNECGKNFFNKHDLHKHSSIHSKVKPYSCSVCQKQFSRLTSLQRHQKLHKDETHYACPHCDDKFFTTEELEKHKDSAHKKEKRFECNICNKRFLYKQGLQRHETLHSNEDKKFMCDYCKETFHTCTKLARHLSTHAGPRPYMCKLCPRTFLLSHHLTRHMRMSHSKDKRRVHKKCSKKNSEMLKLMRIKHARLGLNCDVCQEFCRNRTDYVIHIKQHIEAGEKIDSNKLQPNTKKNLELKSNVKEKKEKDQHDGDGDHELPACVVKKLPKSPMPSESENKEKQNREDKTEKSEKQEKKEPKVVYICGKDGNMVKITTLIPIQQSDIQKQIVTKQTTSIDSSSQSSSKSLTSSQIKETPKSDHVYDIKTQAQKIVTSVFKEQNTPLKHQHNDQDQKLLTPVTRIQSSYQEEENHENDDKAETLASTPNTIKVKTIKRIVMRKSEGGSSEGTSASTSGIKDEDSSLNDSPDSRKIKRVIVSRIIRRNDNIHEVIMNPDGTCMIDSAKLTNLSTGNIVKRVVTKVPLDNNQNLVQAILQSAKQCQETEGITNGKSEMKTSMSSSDDMPKSSDTSEEKQLIVRDQDQKTQGEVEAVGEAV
ncbi:PREDICTED: zinc finger and BTB domain-containing protein 24-like [Cyphomyrmex costatus]|uniref:Zinc finger protein 3 like protein n=1 Tax=Cyphomyrmex costatus TaxID=456900 RepID=A0A151IC97_9HYME|nr:PREDICTED: zinc finger and BTB domain-containing protein 24-like [Cyphomyrmex costatus]KYM97713.1 Zinc finger protein 3 like protein [Cyphomyrmex costatus]